MQAYVIYEVALVFTVDLEADRIESAEVDSSTLSHLDTGLAERPPTDWRRLHQEARAIVERNPRAASATWSSEP
jgi:hypothetical protein